MQKIIKLKNSQFKQLTSDELFNLEEKYMDLIYDLYLRNKISTEKYHKLFQIVWFRIHGYMMRDIDMFKPAFDRSYISI